MQEKSRLKVISMFIGVFLYIGFVPAYALGGAITGTGDVTRGAHEWANNCGACHNLRSPTEFTSDNWQTIMMHMRIQSGVSGQVARDIYAFLSGQGASTQEAPASTATPGQPGAAVSASQANKPSGASTSAPKGQSSKTGAAIFRKTCITCHGANGKGAIPGAPDFTSPNGPLKNSDAILQGRVINGYQAPGSPMAMPPKGGNSALTDEDVKAVIQYIRATFSKG